MDSNQRALAAEIRAEMGAQNLKAAPIQRALGISSTAWGTYFVQCNRDVPMSVIVGVSEHMGLSASELLRRAERRAQREQPARTLSEHITRQTSPDAQAAIAEGARQVKGKSRKRGQGH